VISVPIEDVHPNPFGEDATPESMQQTLDRIKSIDHWSSTFGKLRGHGTIMIDTVSRLVIEGVRQWNFDPDLKFVCARFANVTAATWWILLHSENHTDEKLYDKLLDCAKYFHPHVWKEKTYQRNAVAFLRVVGNEMSTEGMQRMLEQFRAFYDYAAGAGPIAG